MWNYLGSVFFLGYFLLRSNCQNATDVSTSQTGNKHCRIALASNSNSPPPRFWYEDHYPLLNCSNNRSLSVDLDQFRNENIRSLQISYPFLNTFAVDQLKMFRNLTKLQINENFLESIEPSHTDFSLLSLTFLSVTKSYLKSVSNLALRSFPSLNHLVLSGKQLILARDDFIYNGKLTTLHIDCGYPSYFESDWMRFLNLKSLKLLQCSVSFIPETLCNMTVLKHLDLSFNEIFLLPANAFVGCENLHELKLAYNHISRIHESAFLGTTNLAKLDLFNNGLDTLPPGVFDSLNLEELEINLYENPFECNCRMMWFKTWMDGILANGISWGIYFECTNPNSRNSYSSIPWYKKKSRELSDDDFQCQTNKKARKNTLVTCPYNCDCHHESIADFSFSGFYDDLFGDEDSFINFGEDYLSLAPVTTSVPIASDLLGPSMRSSTHREMGDSTYSSSLQCINASLTEIPQENVTEYCQKIYLSGNTISTLRLQQLQRYDQLVELRLPGNQIESIVLDMFLRLPYLRLLDLRSNRIKTISSDMFRSFPHLRAVKLFHNQISEVPVDVFAYNGNLDRLHLGPNPVSSFQEDFLPNLLLKDLSLKSMQLKIVPSSLAQMEHLNLLRLDQNQIEVIKANSFTKCFQLETLTISQNRIERIEADAFKGLFRLKVLDLSLNQLATFSPQPFTHISVAIMTILLHGNPVICDCRLKEMETWTNWISTTQDVFSISFRCQEPLRMRNKMSNQLSNEDFICVENDTIDTAADGQTAKCSNKDSTSVAATIAITVIVTVLICIISIVVFQLLKKRYHGNGLLRPNRLRLRHDHAFDDAAILREMSQTEDNTS